MKPVQRFVARVKPHRTHPEYYEWQTGIVCLLVGESDKAKAQSFAEAEIRRRGWERIEFTDRSTLVEERVIEQGGEFLDAYLNARGGTPFFLEELDEIAFARKSSHPSILAPRLTEAFIDRVVQGAGGHRIDTDQKRPDAPKTADYRVGPWILELKDLQTEGLEIRTRQAKLAKLFASKLRPDRSVIIDPDLLTDDEQREYLNVVSEPIRKRLKDAGRQVRATLDRLSAEKVRGGAIIMNTGYGSVSPAVLAQLASEYAAQSTTISTVICISAWTITNGFDTVVNFAFEPHNNADEHIRRLQDSFWSETRSLMTAWVQNGMENLADLVDPLRPIIFETEDGIFSVLPPKPENSVGKPTKIGRDDPYT